ncbi:MAG TPA: SAM-dependent methyltransferase [Alphaproteobacteria bacterium]|nr:SAM-dependent methyltransferase [Alphaproteobacteria bacterium]
MSDASDHLRRLIALKGPLSLAEFMTEALWHPRDGYYAQSPVLGAAGDYVTAPEISQMFGELVGLWCAVTWDVMGRPAPLHLVELGPGRGTLMADALRAAERMPGFREAAALHLVEASPRLRAFQEKTLAAQGAHWHESFGTVPEGPFILIANEFFDALPILHLERTEAGWRERLVDYDEASGQFRFTLAPHPSPAEALLPPAVAAAAPGSIAEVSPAGLSLASAIGGRLAAHGGAALIVDYGAGESRTGATLQALRRHKRHDALAAPGTADLTAHVDFAALARAATEAGASVHGPVTQGAFLRRLGIARRAERLAAGASPAHAEAVGAALKRLVDPGEMGTLFKVLTLTHRDLPTPAGFLPPEDTI